MRLNLLGYCSWIVFDTSPACVFNADPGSLDSFYETCSRDVISVKLAFLEGVSHTLDHELVRLSDDHFVADRSFREARSLGR
jgi:hypothetical protein